MAAAVSIRQPLSAAEVRAILAELFDEKNQLRQANDPAAAKAIGLAIDYWQAVFARITARADETRSPRR